MKQVVTTMPDLLCAPHLGQISATLSREVTE
jgi:hypothetical protein